MILRHNGGSDEISYTAARIGGPRFLYGIDIVLRLFPEKEIAPSRPGKKADRSAERQYAGART